MAKQSTWPPFSTLQTAKQYTRPHRPIPPSERGTAASQFLAHVYCGQNARQIKMPPGMDAGLSAGDIVYMGTQLPKKCAQQPSPTFWPIYCAQTAGWIKMPPGTKVRLGPGYIILAPCSLKRAQHPPHFSAHVYCGQTAAWIKMPLGTEVGLS